MTQFGIRYYNRNLPDIHYTEANFAHLLTGILSFKIPAGFLYQAELAVFLILPAIRGIDNDKKFIF